MLASEKSRCVARAIAVAVSVFALVALGLLTSEYGREAAIPNNVPVTLLVAILLVIDRVTEPKNTRIRWALTGGLALALLVGAYSANRRDVRGFVSGSTFQTWNVFHYYLGSKYFDELGYRDLYGHVLRAHGEDDLGLGPIAAVNDLYTYRLTTPEQAIARASPDAFSVERWREFKRDVAVLRGQVSAPRFAQMLTDHGYNASPFHTVIYRGLAHGFALQNPGQRMVVLGLDLFFLAGGIAIVIATYGWRRGLAFGAFFTTFFGVTDLQVGGFLRYDWWLATVAAVCLYRRRSFVPAGLALAYATMTRIFPAILLAGPLVQATVHYGRERRLNGGFLRLLGAFVLGCALAVPVGASTGRGYAAWRDFADNIGFHGKQHYLGPKRMGLQKLFAFDYATSTLPGDIDQRARAYEHHRAWHLASTVLLVGLFVVVVLRRRPHDALLLGLAPCFFLLVLSRYYWSVWGLLILLRHGQAGGKGALSDAVVLAIGPVFYLAMGLFRDPYHHYQVVNWAMLLGLVALLVQFAREDRRRHATTQPIGHPDIRAR